MSDVARRKTIFVSCKFTNGEPAIREVLLTGINFDVDDIIIKNVIYYSDGQELSSSIMNFSLLGGDICRLIDGYGAPNTDPLIYTVDKLRIDGLYTITMKDALTGALETDRAGRLTFTLECVKYK